MIQENFIKLYEHSFRENWDLPCYTNYGENESYTLGCKLNFSETSTIGKILREAGVRTARKGEKTRAILMAKWHKK